MKKVLLIDSGSGGINILKECIKIAPYCNFLMFCDTKSLPYGNKSKEELENVTIENLKNIKQFFDYEIVVLACNTLTSACIDRCRKEFPGIIFIGTVPAVKPALIEFDVHDILVLATKVTAKYNVLLNKNDELKLLVMPNLANQIDENLENLNLLTDSLKSELKGLSPKAIVLGCTHYFGIKTQLKEILGENVKIFDSANGVARRLLEFVSDTKIEYQVQIMTSDDNDMHSKLCWYFNSLK